jgi:hypothetical protein
MPEEKLNPVTIRLPAELLARVDALVPKACHAPELALSPGEAKRSDVLRLAILRGVAELEAAL